MQPSPVPPSEHRSWISFSLTPGIGIRRLHSLVRLFGSTTAAWMLEVNALIAGGVPPDLARAIDAHRTGFDFDTYMNKVAEAGAAAVPYFDPAYPALLRTLPDAPPVLYVRGTLHPDEPALAVVGTRRATAYGRDVTRELVSGLTRNGLAIVSGLAHGIDAYAHRAALESGGRTIAVLGCGIDRVYPSDHTKLAGEIAAQGAVISEFPVGTAPNPGNFPRRNRVMSGIALGVLVVEAPEKSGSLITAQIAAEQGREVFAVPGSIFSPASAGTHALIADGAKLVNTAEDILSELPDDGLYSPLVNPSQPDAPALPPLDETQIALLRAFDGERNQIDDLIRASKLPSSVVSGTLITLELQGFIEPEQGGVYRITRAALHYLSG